VKINPKLIKNTEWIVAILVSAMVLFVLFVRVTHAGALWRDEAEAVQMARLPQFSDVIANLKYSSFPVLFPGILRVYTNIFGASDVSLRVFGLAMGLSVLGIAWFHSRALTRDWPLLFPVLIGLNTTFLTTGLSVRGYGIGGVLILLTTVLTMKLLLEPSRWLLLGVFFSSLAAMQTLFFNIPLVFAIVVGAAAVLLLRRDFRRLMWFLATAALSGGLAYLTYRLNAYGTYRWAKVLEEPFSINANLWRLIAACGEPYQGIAIAWIGVVLLSLIGAVWAIARARVNEASMERDMLLFAGIALPVSVLSYYAILSRTHNETQSRYFLALICFLAIATDLIASNLHRHLWIRVARLGLVIVATLALPIAIWPKIIKRQSNIDIVAAEVSKGARPNDLVVVNPWYFGISFGRYYDGQAKWLMLPQIAEHRFHRYDLLHAKIASEQPVADVFDAVRATLLRGNRVWIVGGTIVPSVASPEGLELPSAPRSEFGWSAKAYYSLWSQQLYYLIRDNCTQGHVVLDRMAGVDEVENVPLWLAEGQSR
jgi:hypothetical protein